MGRILIRNVDDGVIATLKRRARENGTSTEEEARRSLAADAGFDREAWLRRLDEIRRQNGPQTGPTSLEILREDRARDDEA